MAHRRDAPNESFHADPIQSAREQNRGPFRRAASVYGGKKLKAELRDGSGTRLELGVGGGGGAAKGVGGRSPLTTAFHDDGDGVESHPGPLVCRYGANEERTFGASSFSPRLSSPPTPPFASPGYRGT